MKDRKIPVIHFHIHELLLLPDFGRAEAEELGQLVREVNQVEVAPEDGLSDHVYYYDRQTDEIQIAI